MNCSVNDSQQAHQYGSHCNATISREYQRVTYYNPIFITAAVPVLIFIISVALVGNLLACLSILLNRSLRKSATNYFIFSLALSDLLTASIAMPFELDQIINDGRWSYNNALCQAWITAYLLAVPTSILSLLAISVDRYITLRDPLNRYRQSRLMTRKRAAIIIASLWCYSLLFSLLPIMGWKEHPNMGSIYYGFCVMNASEIYSALSSAVNFLLPALIMCIIYFRIYLIARGMNCLRDVTNGAGKNTPAQADRAGVFTRPVTSFSKRNHKILQKNLKAAKTISVLVSTFFFCWVPYSVVSIVGVVDKPLPVEVPCALLLLGYLNSALNPFLYVFHNKKFMETYRRYI